MMNNDDVKKFIDLSKLYTEVQLDEKKQVDENWFTDKIKEIFGITDTEAQALDKTAKKSGIDTDNPEGKDAKKAGIDNPNIQGNNFATDADGNITSTDKPRQPGRSGFRGGAQGGGADQDKPVGKSFADIGQAMLGVDQVNVGDKVTIGGQEATVNAGDDGKKFFLGPNGKPITAATGDTSTATNTDATQEPVNTKDLMTRYNEGGKKAMPEIKKLQTELGRLGFDPNGIDGKYGNGTYKAVQQFQKANGLSVDGQAGADTLAAIEKSIKGEQPDAEKPLPADQDQSPQDGAEPDSAQASNDAQAAQDKADANPLLSKSAIQQNLERFNILLKKAQESDQAGVPNANADAQQRGVQVASTDFRHLISLVESVLNEALTAEEEKELQRLYKKLQGQVGKSPELDQAIEDALNLYLKVKSPQADAGKLDDPTTKIPQVVDKKGPDGQYDGDDLGNAPTAPKVSGEVYIQNGGKSANFNVSQMKKKYPTPYIQIPQPDGTVVNGYGQLPNLELKAKSTKGAKIIGKPVSPAATYNDKDGTSQQSGKPNANADAQQRGVQTASKDNNMKKAIKEASMNISINGDSAAEVAELAGILKNAGMNTGVQSMPGGAALDIDKDGQNDMEIMPHNHMDGHDDMVSKMRLMEPPSSDSPCGMDEEGVEEDWDNSPEETYADTQTMTKDLSGGLNRQKKAYPAAQDGDNAMAVETSIKEQLWAALNEKMTEGDKKRGKKMKLKASRGNEDIQTTEGSKGKESRGKKKKESRG